MLYGPWCLAIVGNSVLDCPRNGSSSDKWSRNKTNYSIELVLGQIRGLFTNWRGHEVYLFVNMPMMLLLW